MKRILLISLTLICLQADAMFSRNVFFATKQIAKKNSSRQWFNNGTFKKTSIFDQPIKSNSNLFFSKNNCAQLPQLTQQCTTKKSGQNKQTNDHAKSSGNHKKEERSWWQGGNSNEFNSKNTLILGALGATTGYFLNKSYKNEQKTICASAISCDFGPEFEDPELIEKTLQDAEDATKQEIIKKICDAPQFFTKSWKRVLALQSIFKHIPKAVMPFAQAIRPYFKDSISTNIGECVIALTIQANQNCTESFLDQTLEHTDKLITTHNGCFIILETIKNNNVAAQTITRQVLKNIHKLHSSNNSKEIMNYISENSNLTELTKLNPLIFEEFIANLRAKPALLEHCSVFTTIAILLNCPQELCIQFIETLFIYFDTHQIEKLSQREFDCLRYAIADVMLLFDLDMQMLPSNKGFYNTILKAMENLHASYTYRQINRSNTALKKWLETQLTDEFLDVKNQIEKKLEQSIVSFEKIKYPLHIKYNEDQFFFDSNLSKYIRCKLYALGFTYQKIILTDYNLIACVTQYALNIEQNAITQMPAIAMNGLLAHEMMHEKYQHCAQKNDIHEKAKKKEDNSLNHKPDNTLEIFQEKFADIHACLQAGPTACKMFAKSLFALKVEGRKKEFAKDEHCPAPLRRIALLDLAQQMERKNFDLSKKTPLTQWARSKCKHPIEEFKKFCDIEEKEIDGKIMISMDCSDYISRLVEK